MKNLTTAIAVAGIVAIIAPLAGASTDLPARPEKIQFQPLEFQPPNAKDFRRTLSNGVPVYIMPSSEFPLVNITFSFKGGAYLEPDAKAGLASMTGAMIRRGGTTSVSAQDLDEAFDFLAANASTFVGSTTAGATLNTLTSNLDESFALFIDMLRNPGFQADKVDIYRAEAIEQMRQRNDDADNLLAREWGSLMWGREHFEGRVSTRQSLSSVSIDDMKAFHKRLFHPGNLIIGITGDVQEADILARLEKALAGWAKGEPVGDPPAPSDSTAPGLYHVEKDIPQGKIRMGMRGLTRDDPDAIAVSVMNDILGGGGFTSRIMNRVRSEEGLAYGASSGFLNRVWYPGEFRAGFASKNRTCALATRIIMEEIDRIKTQPVGKDELETAKNQFIETFPRNFESKPGTVGLFINDEWTNRPADYWQTYRDRVRAVDAAEVQRVAQKYLDPSRMMILVVGKWDEIAPGNIDEQRPEKRVDMSAFFGGQVDHLPLRDPLTQEPLQQPARN